MECFSIKKKALLADLALLLVAAVWGGGFIAGKAALSDMQPFHLLTFRFLISGGILSLIFWKKIKSIGRKSLLSGTILGLVLCGGLALQTTGLQYTTPGKQAFLIAVYPVLVPFLNWMMTKQRPGLVTLIAGAVTVFGVSLLCLDGSGLSLQLGDSLSLAFAAVFALQIVLTGIFAKDVDPIQLTVVQLFSAGISALVLNLIFEPAMGAVGGEAWAGVIYLIALNTVVAFTIQNVAQRYTSATHASLIVSLECVFGALLSAWLMGEVLTGRKLVGSILIFGAVLLAEWKGSIPSADGQ